MKIIGIVNNYPQHDNKTEETNITTAQPVLFTKTDATILKDGKPFFVPDNMGTISWKSALVVRLCKLGKSVPARFAHRYYDAITVGVDFTATDMQKQLAKEGLPWDLAKSFDGSLVLGSWLSIDQIKDVNMIQFNTNINETPSSEGFTNDMLHKIDELIEYISQFITIKTGDLLITGGVGEEQEVLINQHFEGFIENRKVLDFYSR